MEQVVLDVNVAPVLKLKAPVPVTSPGPSRFSVAAAEVPTETVPVILNVIPDANVSVTVTPFAIFNVAIDPIGNVETEMDVFVLMSQTSLLYKFPG